MVAILGVLALSGSLLSLVSTATASTEMASADPLNYTPHVLDNRAYAVAQVGSRVVVGGNFTQIQPADTTKPVEDQASLFAFDAATGEIDPNFMPQVNGEVLAVLPHPDGNKVYIAGNFSKVNGQTASRVALLNLADGQLVSTFAPPLINAEVNDIRLKGPTLYIGGDFDSLGPSTAPITREHLASLDATTGALTDRMNVDIAGANNGGGTTVRHFDIAPDGKSMVAIGNFATVNGKSRKQIAMFTLTGAVDKLRKWATPSFANNCNPVFDTYMRDVDFSPDGKFFIVVTTGSYRFGTMCDTASRWETGVNKPNRAPTWTTYSGGDTFVAVEVAGPLAYVGGHMRWVNNPFAGDKPGSGAVPREGLAALDTRNGLPLTWDPTRARGYGVFDFFPTASTLWAVSDTNIWAGETRPRLAGFPFAGGVTLPPDLIGTLPSEVLLLGKSSPPNQNNYRVISFDGTTVNDNQLRNGTEAWSNATGAFMVDNQVFTGWNNGTFKVRTFDGTSWGLPENIPLYAGTPSTAGYPSNFINDVGKLTGIVYDPTSSRIYYTMAGDTRLLWREFTPESRIVGAKRNVVTGGAKINPQNVRGMFLTGSDLYYADNTTGALHRIVFSNGKFVGTPDVVNNTMDWRAPGMVLSTQPSSSGPNTPPVAAFTPTCTGLSCSFDSSLSNDPDGVIADYSWDFGDGAMDDTANPQHLYQTAGDYTVTLTVTDNRGDTNTTSQSINVAPIPSSIDFRAATQSAPQNKGTSATVTVPGAVEEGDTMLLFASNAGGSGGTTYAPNVPAGWTLLDTRSDDELTTDVYYKVADADDLGQQVTVSIPTGASQYGELGRLFRRRQPTGQCIWRTD